MSMKKQLQRQLVANILMDKCVAKEHIIFYFKITDNGHRGGVRCLLLKVCFYVLTVLFPCGGGSVRTKPLIALNQNVLAVAQAQGGFVFGLIGDRRAFEDAVF